MTGFDIVAVVFVSIVVWRDKSLDVLVLAEEVNKHEQ